MFEIFVEDKFSAAHNLMNYRGKCEKLHGHNYRVQVFAAGKRLGGSGMLLDFTVLKKELSKTLERLDHGYLNEIKPFDEVNPTAENIAKYIHGRLKPEVAGGGVNLIKVSVWETETNCATYYEER